MNATERKGLEAAIEVLQAHGLDISAPWDGDLDDLEQERFDAVRKAIEAYLVATGKATT